MQLQLQGLSSLAVSFTVVTLMVAGLAGCQNVRGGVDAERNKKDPSIWTLHNGQAEVVVNAAIGRIVRFGFRSGDGKNVLWLNTEPKSPAFDMGGWTNWGGDKVWPWPQSLFGWPPPEPKQGYNVEAVDQKKALLMTSEPLPGYGVRIIRKIELASDSPAMTVTSWFEPTGEPMTKQLGVWSITQVPTPRDVFVRIPLTVDRTRFLGRAATDGFKAQPAGGNVVQVTGDPDKGGKTFFDGDVIAAVFDDVALLMRQVPVQEQGVWAADERAQIYAHPIHAKSIPVGPSYYELEWTAPTVQAAIAPQAPLKVRYELVKLDKKATPEAIAKMVEKLP